MIGFCPYWSKSACHGRGGCTSLIVHQIPSSPPIIISSGRTFGEVRRWRLAPLSCLPGGLGSAAPVLLELVGSVQKPCGLTWMDRLQVAPAGRGFFAFGFHSVMHNNLHPFYFKAF
ncbi:unnamed protein product [Protopolystoma xenopodis]|uniref:Uncharacterized protein n=1 Tax=Protopolystoma xenopodis TaxID=117903 RepID=A0A3S5ATX1_9PLAT|nr:unnamed protein product [Protopolystoma xenopodis]